MQSQKLGRMYPATVASMSVFIVPNAVSGLWRIPAEKASTIPHEAHLRLLVARHLGGGVQSDRLRDGHHLLLGEPMALQKGARRVGPVDLVTRRSRAAAARRGAL